MPIGLLFSDNWGKIQRQFGEMGDPQLWKHLRHWIISWLKSNGVLSVWPKSPPETRMKHWTLSKIPWSNWSSGMRIAINPNGGHYFTLFFRAELKIGIGEIGSEPDGAFGFQVENLQMKAKRAMQFNNFPTLRPETQEHIWNILKPWTHSINPYTGFHFGSSKLFCSEHGKDAMSQKPHKPWGVQKGASKHIIPEPCMPYENVWKTIGHDSF